MQYLKFVLWKKVSCKHECFLWDEGKICDKNEMKGKTKCYAILYKYVPNVWAKY